MNLGDWVEWIGTPGRVLANNPNTGRVIKLGKFIGTRPEYKDDIWWTYSYGTLYNFRTKEKLGHKFVREFSVRPIVGGLKERKALRVAAYLMHGF